MNYLQFNRRERSGIIAFCILIAALFIYPEIFARLHQEPPTDFSALIAALNSQRDTLPPSSEEQSPPSSSFASYTQQSSAVKTEINSTPKAHSFDPNTAAEEELLSLGLPPRTTQSILRYREKGGKFKSKEDLKKIYTLSTSDFERLEPYISISSTGNKPKAASPIDVNQADEEQWRSLPGIGASYANRILKYKEALGGFVSTQQVGEVWGMPDSVFLKIEPWLRITPCTVRQIDVNSATVEDLDAHPYLNKSHAWAIVNYRERSGKFKNVEQVQILSAFDDKKGTFSKIKPYLSAK